MYRGEISIEVDETIFFSVEQQRYLLLQKRRAFFQQQGSTYTALAQNCKEFVYDRTGF